MTTFAYLLSDQSVTVYLDGSPYPISKTNSYFSNLMEAIKKENLTEIKRFVELAKEVRKYVANNLNSAKVEMRGNDLYYNGKYVNNAVARTIRKFAMQNLPYKPLLKFFERLMNNPSKTAVDELYLFLESGHIPIAPDGRFLAYKVVNKNYKDHRTNSFDNSIGAKMPPMDRNEVDDDRNRTCSTGFHFCSLGYVPHYGSSTNSRVMIVAVDPADVVAIPSDYKNCKGRATTYEVVGEYENFDWDNTEDFSTDVLVDVNPSVDTKYGRRDTKTGRFVKKGV